MSSWSPGTGSAKLCDRRSGDSFGCTVEVLKTSGFWTHAGNPWKESFSHSKSNAKAAGGFHGVSGPAPIHILDPLRLEIERNIF